MSIFEMKVEEFGEFGVVKAIYHPVVKVGGLEHVKPNEMVIFENGVSGRVMNLARDSVEVLLFSHYPVRVGQRLARTGDSLKIPLGDYLRGKIVDPLGRPLLPIDDDDVTALTTELDEAYDEKKLALMASEYRLIDIPPPNILKRREILRPFSTGVTMIDTLLPLGQGQREMVVGDRKTGKTSFLLTAMKSHAMRDGVVIYVAIGKRSIEIEALRSFVITERISNDVVLLATTSHDAASLVYTAPFAGMTMAEYFRDKGHDVLLILDDLSTHAKFYREISLQAHRFPGRDSYPGDIFFTHSRLLERSGNFDVNGKEIAITCLPVAETTDNDLSDYIVSNLIGITDGHILFDYNEFMKGRRPAISPSLSVTRVGKQTQTPLHQEINRYLLAFLQKYQKSQGYSHFSNELSNDVQKLLNTGNRLHAFFQQPVVQVVPHEVQLFFIGYILGDDPLKLQEVSLLSMKALVLDLYSEDESFRTLITGCVHVTKIEDLKKNCGEIMKEVYKIWQAKNK